MKKNAVKKISPYTLLNKWLYDGSKTTKIPPEVISNKVVSQNILLYHFQQSKYIVYLSEVFNNFYLYSLDREEVFHFLKECIQRTGFRPRFIPRIRQTYSKTVKILTLKFPLLKKDDIKMLIEKIDESEQKDAFYEMIGIRKPKKLKNKKKDKEAFKLEIEQQSKKESLGDLMENFG